MSKSTPKTPDSSANPPSALTPRLPALTVEYLIILNAGNTFCNDVETFNRLLRVDSAIAIKAGKLSYSAGVACDYRIAAGEVSGRDQRYFQVELTLPVDEDAPDASASVDRFLELLKAVRSAIAKTGAHVETLWDGTSFFYSRRAYTIFYRLENTMRKLIVNFMLTTVGKEWVTETSPEEVREAISKSKRKDYANVLHTVDFIHLADFLVKPYSRTEPKDLYSKIRAAQTVEAIRELETDLPASNWQRYFATLVNCEDSFLQKRWKDLYELRCMVAHNSIFTRADYLRTHELAGELFPLLENALQKLPQVTVSPDERETLAENAATTINSLVGDFISAWRILEHYVLRFAQGTGAHVPSVVSALPHLQRAKGLELELARQIRELSSFRNQLVHGTGAMFSEEEIIAAIRSLISIIDALKVFPDPPTTD